MFRRILYTYCKGRHTYKLVHAASHLLQKEKQQTPIHVYKLSLFESKIPRLWLKI